MDIAINKENTTLTIAVSGRLDTVTAPELEKALTDNIAGAESLIFDLEGLEYTSSAGLRVLLKAQKMMRSQGNMKLVHVCDEIMEILDMTGFSDIMIIE